MQICKSEERCDEYHRLYKPSDSCNTRRALKYYNDEKDKILEKMKNFYIKKKENRNDNDKKRKSKKSTP